MTVYPLWEGACPGTATETPTVTFYPPEEKQSDAAFVIFPGGGYHHRARHEGEGYAEFLNGFGITAFVVDYRVTPAHFPAPLLDARRAVRFVRANAEKFGIDPQKIAVMGSSAGGHLAALVSTYCERIEGEGADAIDEFDPIPNGQVLCYPVISSDETLGHTASYHNLLGDRYEERAAFSPELLVTTATPRAFIWHATPDAMVSVIHSYRYATALREAGVPCELHTFPVGTHGMGVAANDPHVAQWVELLRRWLMMSGFLPEE